MRDTVSSPDEFTLSLPIPDPDVVARRVGDEVVLVHLGTSHIFALNSTGARFWELLNSCSSWEEIEDTIQNEYDASPGDVRKSITGLLTNLEAEGLVRRRET